MRVFVKTLVLAAQNAVRSPLLPIAAVMLITIFTVSLALAEPHADSLQVLAARENATGMIALENAKTLVNDGVTDAEAALFSAPMAPKYYHDRYRFYHRYDLYPPRSRFNSLDDGLN